MTTESERRHQGYTNYETFSVGIVLMTDRKRHEWCLRQARERLAFARAAEAEGGEPARERAVGALATRLRSWGDAQADAALDRAPALLASAFRAGYGEVDWLDIAREWVDMALELESETA